MNINTNVYVSYDCGSKLTIAISPNNDALKTCLKYPYIWIWLVNSKPILKENSGAAHLFRSNPFDFLLGKITPQLATSPSYDLPLLIQ